MIDNFIASTHTKDANQAHFLNNGQFYTSLFDYHPDAVYAIDQEGCFILANPALQKLTGYALEELMQQSFTMLPTSDRTVRLERYREALSGQPQKYETLVTHKDGHAIHVFVTLVPIRIDGDIVGVFGFAKDISERKRVEEHLRKTEAIFTLLSENAQDIITISDPSGVTQYISTSCRTKLGYEPEEVIGVKTTHYWHPEDVEQLSKQTFGDIGIFETRVRHKDGQYLWLETAFKNIINEAGHVECIIGVGRDITLRKQAEDELFETKELLDSFIEQNVDAIAFFDRDGRMTRMNDVYKTMFGWSKDELVGTFVFELPNVPAEWQADVRESRELLLANQKIVGVEKRRMRKDGSSLFVRLSSFPITNSLGVVQGWAVVMRDISEQKKAEELLLQTEKLSVAGQLAAGIAHEIRNPLTALKGFTQLIKAGGNTVSEYLNIMEAEMNRIEAILSELLVLAKPQLNAFDEQVDVTKLIQDVVSLMQSQANMSNIEIDLQMDPNLPRITCDANQIKQVFINFTKNAIEAMPNGGQLTIDLQKAGEQISVRFQDGGVGIHPDLLKRIGEPFYTTKEKGTGLGMMVSKKIIENHHGLMHVQSELNKGTSVEVILPRMSSQ